MRRGARLGPLLAALREAYPAVTTELDWRSPFQLLVATVLSAQSTDRGVNAVTPGLFARFGAPEALAQAPLEEIEATIRTLGLYRSKARHLKALAQVLVDRHGGCVPARRAALEALPGVGRKTASVVLATAFGIPALAVDTHVFRVAHRLGLSGGRTPVATERDLRRRIPRRDWIWSHHALIHHGRRVCHARRPACDACSLSPYCPRIGVQPVGAGPAPEEGPTWSTATSDEAASRSARSRSARGSRTARVSTTTRPSAASTPPSSLG